MITNLEKRFIEVSLIELHDIRESLRDLNLIVKAILNQLITNEKSNSSSN